jgi:hypothetical protein
MRQRTRDWLRKVLNISKRLYTYVRSLPYTRVAAKLSFPISHEAKVLEAKKRILIMEFIRGGRPDDLQYLADHNIDRNVVSLELARIFSQMVHLNGFFHAVSRPGH